MEPTRLMLSSIWFVACSSLTLVAGADQKQPADLNRLLAATAAKIPAAQPVPDPSPTPAEAVARNAGLVRLYQVRSEVQLADSKVAHSDSAAYLIRLSVDNDFVVLHNDHADVRYRITGRRFVYQSEEGQESMQVSAPAIVAVRFEQSRVEGQIVTTLWPTILRYL